MASRPIYFDNTDVYPTVDYQVQKLYGNNSGTTYVPADMAIASDNDKVKVRIGSSIVKDDATGDYIPEACQYAACRSKRRYRPRATGY